MTRGVLGHGLVQEFWSENQRRSESDCAPPRPDLLTVAVKILHRSAHVCGLRYSDPEACLSN
jgi:hypothetical protein